ncbi:hypothetical protein C358_02507 [Cryptococcus neoformans MW-RSA852]|nr:hypothetical protein C358_02507 [Cryptococcus neoformans var. grubii MW-RSA852]
MNLDMLYEATELIGDPKYAHIATQQAEKSLNSHVRPDYTTYHVVDFNQDGNVKKCMTHQGYADESTWSPGQSWAIYGYAQCGRKDFLETVFELLPESGVPWWDFDSPKPCPYDAHTTPLQAPSRPAACSCFIASSDPSIHARPSNTSSSRSSSSTT